MITKICLVCKKEFKTIPSRIKIGAGKFCSKKCYGKSMMSRVSKRCLICKKKFKVKSSRKDIAKFCSYKCMGKNYVGKNNPQWKGGKKKSSDNRWLINSPNHPFTRKDKYIFQSRLVAEKCLGRYLTRKEVIHHINGNKSDDRPENLYLFPSHSEHRRFHHLKNKPTLKSNLI